MNLTSNEKEHPENTANIHCFDSLVTVEWFSGLCLLALTAGATIPGQPLSWGPSYHKIAVIYGWPTASFIIWCLAKIYFKILLEHWEEDGWWHDCTTLHYQQKWVSHQDNRPNLLLGYGCHTKPPPMCCSANLIILKRMFNTQFVFLHFK